MTDVWIFDIDGTLALRGDRKPYDWSRVGEDKPNAPIVAVAEALLVAEEHILYVSGRSDVCDTATRTWLYDHVHGTAVAFGYEYLLEGLFMRADGDFRPDTVIKREIYDRHIAGKYTVRGVFEDRNSMVRMWRDLGLTCLQVACGDF
jgi:hypothetical protein